MLGLLVVPTVVRGEVTKVNITNRVTVANGQAFGKTGPYEKLTGTIEFAVDPKSHTTRASLTSIAPCQPPTNASTSHRT